MGLFIISCFPYFPLFLVRGFLFLIIRVLFVYQFFYRWPRIFTIKPRFYGMYNLHSYVQWLDLMRSAGDSIASDSCG